MTSSLRISFLLLVATLTFNLSSNAQIPGFPQDGIEDRVAFWEKVFTIYGEDDLIIHDRERADLIYAVVNEDSRRSGVARVNDLLGEVRRRIASPEQLSPDARRLYDAIKEDGVRMTAGDIAVLQGRIHTQRGIKERFREGVIRSGRYIRHFEEVFESEGVPTLITRLPLVESSFLNEARSSAGAAGIWQFMPATGRQFMSVTRGRDDRLDPAVATRAAARLLKGNFERLKSWPLAITAYNHGTAGVARARAAHGSDLATIIRNYNARTWGYASKNFYAEFIAAVNVYENYEIHFGPLALDSPIDFRTPATRITSRPPANAAGGTTHRVGSGETLGAIAYRYGTSVDRIKALNGLGTDLIFAGETIIVSMDAAEAAPDGRYLVRLGDTLSEIAELFGVGIQELMSLNRLRSSTIYAGQTLMVR